MVRKQNLDPTDVSIEVNGKTYTGRYEVTRGIITVTYGMGTKRTQVGGSPPEILAEVLMQELVEAEEELK